MVRFVILNNGTTIIGKEDAGGVLRDPLMVIPLPKGQIGFNKYIFGNEITINTCDVTGEVSPQIEKLYNDAVENIRAKENGLVLPKQPIKNSLKVIK